MNGDWLSKLERRLGFLAVPGLAVGLTAMNAAVGVLSYLKPEFPSQLDLNPLLLRQGEVWRIVTFLFVPPDMGPLWLILWLLLFYVYSRALEVFWGDFKFTLFCAIGALAASAASVATGIGFSNALFDISLFLAFARLNPEFEILIFFFFPVKMKWLSLLTWVYLGWVFLFGNFASRWDVASGLANYAVFFGPGHLQDLRFSWRRWRNDRY